MTDKLRRNPWHFKAAEYRSVQPDIAALLERSGCVKSVHEELRRAGRLTMCYQTFCNYVRHDGFRTPRMKKSLAPKPLSPPSEILDNEEFDFDGLGPDLGNDSKSVYQNLVGLGVASLGYSDFCDYFQEYDT